MRLGDKSVSQGGSPRLRLKCTHDKRGVCGVHGQAVKKFRPGHEMIVGPDGGLKKKYVRKSYWKCDLDLMGEKKLKQPTLNFKMMTQNNRMGGCNDGPITTGGFEHVPSTSKVGQNMNCGRVAGGDEVAEDKKRK